MAILGTLNSPVPFGIPKSHSIEGAMLLLSKNALIRSSPQQEVKALDCRNHNLLTLTASREYAVL